MREPGSLTRALPTPTRNIVMLAFENAQMLDVTGPLEVFSRASRWLQDNRGIRTPAYDVELVALRAGPLCMSNGLTILVSDASSVRTIDTMLICGGLGYADAAADTEVRSWLTSMAPRARRIVGVCTGSLVLAAGGLLKGHRATTHWRYLDELGSVEPSCIVDRNSIYVRSGKVMTTAGVTAGMDAALALVEDDHGRSAALHVAQELVMYLRRPGDQAQFSRHLAIELRNTPFAELERWVLDNLDADLRIAALAARAGLSERHFVRRFTTIIGSSPASWVRNLRIEAARCQLEQGAASLKDVARRSGFGDEQTMRRAFQTRLGITPSEYVARFS